MIKWIYNDIFLEKQETLFVISMIIIIMIIISTIYLVHRELKNSKSI